MHKIRRAWRSLPRTIRRPIVLTVGSLVVLSSGLIGWLPGPGGIPLFLLGIAILATEFAWAERLKRSILHLVSLSGSFFRRHPFISTILVVIALGCSILIGTTLYRALRQS